MPNRTALVSLAVGIAGTVAAVVFGASLDRLTTDPAAFGWSWDVTVANCSTLACTDDAADRLEANPDVAAYTGLNESEAQVDGQRIGSAQFRLGRGWSGGRILDGAPPVGPRDIVLAEASARDLDVAVGDEVEVEIDNGTPVAFRVTGLFVPPAVLSDALTLSEGAGITAAGLRRATPDVDADLSRRSQYFLVTFDPDVDRGAAMARLREDFATTILEPVRTEDIEGVHRIRQLPTLLAALVAFLAFLTLVHFVVATARRRRTALASLQALGGGRGLGRGALAWHASLVVSAGLAIGLPIGVAVGRTGWLVAADALEVPVDPVTPAAALVVVVISVLLAGGALGRGSYRLRSRPPARALRGD